MRLPDLELLLCETESELKIALYLIPFRFGVHLKFEGPDFYKVENHKSWRFQLFSFTCHFLPKRSFYLIHKFVKIKICSPSFLAEQVPKIYVKVGGS